MSGATMRIVTKCERIQPTCAGVDRRGELVWEGREMPDWQKKMFLVRYQGDFVTHWLKIRSRMAGHDLEGDSMDISYRKTYGKHARHIQGD